MRAGGVPNFPDPNAQGVIAAGGIDGNPSQVHSARQQCIGYLANVALSPAQQVAGRLWH
jgi:hypothetical protein